MSIRRIMVVTRQRHTQILSREKRDKQQRVHERLRASEARYRACFEGASVGQALTDLDGSFIEEKRRKDMEVELSQARTLTFATEVGKGTTFTIRLPKGQAAPLQ